VEDFLRGHFAADGSAQIAETGTVTVSAATVSSRLAAEEALLLRHIGIRTKTRCYEPSSPRGRLPVYEIRIADVHNADLFTRRVGFLSERKQASLLEARHPEEKFSTRGHSIAHQGLLDDFLQHAKGLDYAVRSEIACRCRAGFCNIEWAARLAKAYPQLQDSKLAKLLIEGSDYAIIRSVTPVPDQEWVHLVTATGEPVFGNAFAVAASKLAD
jgi:hypothetical protein